MSHVTPPALILRESAGGGILNSGIHTLTHNMGRLPKIINVFIVCVSNDAASGFVAGDIISMPGGAGNNTSSGYHLQISSNAVSIRYGATFAGYFQRKSDGAQVGVTSLANFTSTIQCYF